MRPPVFQDLEIDAARERTLAERKLLLVDVSGESAPCIEMNRTR